MIIGLMVLQMGAAAHGTALDEPTPALTVPAPATVAANHPAMTFIEAETRLRNTSSLSRAADYGVQAAEAQERAAGGLYRPTVALEAQVIRYRKTFDLSLSNALDNAQREVAQGIDGLLSDLPTVPPGIIEEVGSKLNTVLPEIFSGLPRDIRLELNDTLWRPSVTALQPIYTGGAIPAIQRAAAANVSMAQARHSEVQNLENVGLVQAYFGQVLASEALAIAIDTRNGFDQHLRNAIRMQQEGVLSRAEMLQVEVARDTAQREVNSAELALENAKASLANLVDINGGITPTTPLFVNRESVGPAHLFLDEAGRSNPSITQARAGQDLANAGADLAAASFKPTVYAFGTYNLNPRHALPTEPDWAVGIGASYTLLSSLDRRRSLEAARLRASAAGEAERHARDQARLLVTRAYNQVELARRQYLTLESSMTAARENLRVQELGFREGEATATAVIDAQNMLGAARLQRAAAAYEYDLSLAALLAASGSRQTLSHYNQREDRITAP